MLHILCPNLLFARNEWGEKPGPEVRILTRIIAESSLTTSIFIWGVHMKKEIVFLVAAVLTIIGCGAIKSPTNSSRGDRLQAPILESPSNGVGNQAVSLNLMWNASPSATSYGVQVSTSSSFSTTILIQTDIPVMETSVYAMDTGTTYYWRVNAADSAGMGPWSIVWSFTTQNASSLIGMGMRFLPGGTFTMGSNDSNNDWCAQPPHQVTVSSFYIDTTPVTQASFKRIMLYNPSSCAPNDNRPVESVSWYDAVLYCNARSKLAGYDTIYSYSARFYQYGNWCDSLEGLSINYAAHGFRLPTEAEWEYACRAGTTTEFYWGNNSDSATLTEHTWFNNGISMPVATKPPNAWGLYDMEGNISHWCNDFFAYYNSITQTDPTGPDTGLGRVVRGGSYWGNIVDCFRSASRIDILSSEPFSDVGFRCVRR